MPGQYPGQRGVLEFPHGPVVKPLVPQGLDGLPAHPGRLHRALASVQARDEQSPHFAVLWPCRGQRLEFTTETNFWKGNSIYVGAAVGAIFVPAGLSAVGIKAFVRAYQIYTSPKFNIIRKAYADGSAAEVDIDRTLVLYDPGFSDEGLSLSFMNGFLLGPKAFKTPADVAKTILHETYRLEARTDGPIGGEYATQETKEADEFANMGYKTLMEGAEAGESIGDGGGGEGVGGNG